ncbi:MAG TPA: hypothetical protein VLG12_01875 [Candidatus Saccharimonadales bacterium]|nr:hypothetical protein [Candidatus Saccharimonadales bacterium]
MKRQREIIILLISMFIVSLAWIGFDLYHNAVTSTISAPLQEDILPIVPSFDSKVIQNLKQRHYSDPVYTLSSQPEVSATPSGKPQTSPTAIPKITVSVTP